MRSSRRFAARALTVLATLIGVVHGGARMARAQSGASPTHAAHASSGSARPIANPADVAFMQGMIGHHAQALVMTAMVPTRTDTPELQLLAQRIAVSQRDEIGLMRAWLLRHGATAPDPLGDTAAAAHAGHGDTMPHMDHAHMPGMLSDAQLAELRAARGRAFDRLFLEYMIQHHAGALVMVRDLFASDGGGQDTEIFQFASDVDADQAMEIARMRRLLATLPN
ncbi:MAG TPA: DUF305 domain-containing protein [Gemmatimonadaceae bacterium]|nr:DUF305 domain-containing protein [Gemmatimonadaceae bacterium]